MLQIILSLIDKVSAFPTASAHCDIPCGIYDPGEVVQAAKTMRRMIEKIAALPEDDMNNRTRMIIVKEEHGKKLKHELSTLWTDYFKPEHLEKVPGLHEHVWKTAKLASKVKQSLDTEAANQLVEACEEFAKLFEQVEGSPEKE